MPARTPLGPWSSRPTDPRGRHASPYATSTPTSSSSLSTPPTGSLTSPRFHREREQRLLEQAPAAVQPGPHRAHRAADDLRDFLVRQLLHEIERAHRAILLRQPGQRVGDLAGVELGDVRHVGRHRAQVLATAAPSTASPMSGSSRESRFGARRTRRYSERHTFVTIRRNQARKLVPASKAPNARQARRDACRTASSVSCGVAGEVARGPVGGCKHRGEQLLEQRGIWGGVRHGSLHPVNPSGGLRTDRGKGRGRAAAARGRALFGRTCGGRSSPTPRQWRPALAYPNRSRPDGSFPRWGLGTPMAAPAPRTLAEAGLHGLRATDSQ